MHYFLINSNVIAEIGFAEFKQNIICSWVTGLGHTKKAPEGADLNSSICFKWWRLGDSNS